eukprot:TRINITY_DN6766_c0_g1_i1.p1 TRINITY_DN6766_c0_g1~~TRINITY_DN6766_c0_g1_i1.p1  ORF type:complete len:315 (+),score=80.95 TRINITY_DN6766_c0_g1_i1:307-1251(+)
MNSENSGHDIPASHNEALDEVSTTTFEEDDGDEQQNKCIRVCVLGFSKVGKSNLVASYVYDKTFQFETEHYETIEDIYRVKAEVKDAPIDVEIVDVGGSEYLHDCRCRQIQLADAFVLVYSTSDRTSFERLHELLDDIRVIKNKQFFPCVLVANKSDLRSNQVCVAKQEGQSLGLQIQAPCIPASARTSSDSQAIFDCILNKCLNFNTQEFCGYFMKAARSDRKSRYGAKKSTKLRYFSLDGATLTWKKRDNAKKVLGSISMQSVESIQDINEQQFQLVCKDGTEHQIQVKSAPMKKEWVRKMRDIMQTSTTVS